MKVLGMQILGKRKWAALLRDVQDHEVCIEKLYDLALNARAFLSLSNDASGTPARGSLILRMNHFLEADCGCIATLTGQQIAEVRAEVERRYETGSRNGS